MAERSSLRLLGPALVERNGQAIPRLATGKALALLAYLVVQGQPVSREHLVDLFWRHLPPDRGRANLSWTLNKIASLLPGCLDARRERVRFCRGDGCWLDLDAFAAEGMARNPADVPSPAQTADRLRKAADLYRGDFLQGLALDGCADFELWLVGERERWRQRAVDVLAGLVTYHCKDGQVEPALHFARRLLALEPWREETHRTVMRLLAECGERGAALAQYEVCCRALEAELGVTPSEETVALYEQIRDGKIKPRVLHAPPVTPLLPHHNLPAHTTPFIGRERQLTEVRALLARPEVRLLTLTGVGGTGKTRLALQVAAGLVDDYRDGVYLIELAPLRTPELVVPTIAAILGVRESGSRPLIEALQYVLRDKKRLLVIDNFEHVVEAAPAVSELLSAAPGLKVLATSRAPLRVYGEHEYPVPPMEVLDPRALPALERVAQAEAVSLFVQGAERVQSGYVLSEEDAPAVAEICARLDGLPLAIELAAARVKLFSPRAMLARLDGPHGLGLLDRGPRNLPARQRSLRATIEWSYTLLSPDERTLFSHLSVFRGGCTLEDVDAICLDPSSILRPSSLALLESLIDQSLLQVSPSTPPRFTLLETVREYAAERLGESSEADALRGRHAAYYARALEGWGKDLKGPRQLEALQEIEADLDNARGAWEWAVERGRVDWLDRALEGLCLYYEWRGRYQQGETACKRAAEGLEGTAPSSAHPEDADRLRVLAHLLARQGHFSFVLGHVEEAARCLERSLILLDGPELDDQQVLAVRAYALYRQSGHVAIAGQFERAGQLAERSLAAYRALGDDWGVVRVLYRQAEMAYNFAAYDRMERLLKEGQALSRASGDRRSIAIALTGLAACVANQGQLERAERTAREGLAISRQVQDGEAIVYATFILANVLRGLGRFADSLLPLRELLTFSRNSGDRRREIVSLWGMSMSWRHLGSYCEARTSAQAALVLAREFDQTNNIGTSCMELGRIALAEGAHERADAWLQQSIAAYEDAERPRLYYQARVACGYVARALARHSMARQHLCVALQMAARDVALQALPAMALLLLDGESAPGQRDAERAVELYALVLRHPSAANSRWFEDVAGREIHAAADALPPEVVASARERGRARDLWPTVEELLAELATDEPE